MPRTRPLLHREITYTSAKEREVNILHQLKYYHQRNQFFAHLDNNRPWIENVVAHHLGWNSSGMCHVSEREHWLHGSFNVCIPVTIQSHKKRRVLIRFPLPYRVGEEFNPGNSDEKIRCEAGTYAWLQENCPDVPIPQLYGFGLSTNETFTRLEYLSTFPRWLHIIRRQFSSWLGLPNPTKYFPHQNASIGNPVNTGYLLIEYIEGSQGVMLSNTWMNGRRNKRLRGNLFRDLSRIILTMSRIPLPRIGSFVIDKNGFLKLINRPLSVELQQMENENIPTDIARDYTYSTVDSYIVDLLGVHDNRFRHQPNAVNDLGDCAIQLATLSAMRTVFPAFFNRSLRRGPFVLSLTDMHQSNIFVDSDWHITCLVDLEWACSLPIEMISTPYWLTNKGVDELIQEEYDVLRSEYMDILAAEEDKIRGNSLTNHSLPALSEVMNQAWATGTFWYTLALSSPSGVFNIFQKHIRPPFFYKEDQVEEFHSIMPFLWGKSIGYIAGCKLSDKEQYDRDLLQAFADGPS